MPKIVIPENIHVDDIPGIWSPVQWELTDEERILELETQATASLLQTVDAPEAILRLLLEETEIERLFKPPKDYDPEQQGEWDPDLITFHFRRAFTPVQIQRQDDHLYVEYKVENLGYWTVDIKPDEVRISRI
jgi:hypothetical protein